LYRFAILAGQFTMSIFARNILRSLIKLIAAVGVIVRIGTPAAAIAAPDRIRVFPSMHKLTLVPDRKEAYALVSFNPSTLNGAAIELTEPKVDGRGLLTVRLLKFENDPDEIIIDGFLYSNSLPTQYAFVTYHVDCGSSTILSADRLDVTDKWYGATPNSHPMNVKATPGTEGESIVRYACEEGFRQQILKRPHLSREDAILELLNMGEKSTESAVRSTSSTSPP